MAAPRSRLRAFWQDWGKPVLIALAVLGSFRSAVADWNDVPTASMRPTILEGDRIFIDKLAYDVRVPFSGQVMLHRGDPARGDIVIFPSPVDGIRLVKRIVGLPGDSIAVRRGVLVVNGEAVRYEPLDESTLDGVDPSARPEQTFLTEGLGEAPHPIQLHRRGYVARDFGPVVVPEGHYFMMGDNRDDSLDSRVFGAVPRDSILGRALAVAVSVDPERSYRPRFARWFTRLP